MITQTNKWFIQKENQSLGPYTLEQMIQLKQNKNLFDHDYVWAEHLPDWIRVHFVTELKSQTHKTSFKPRKYERFPIEAECYISNANYTYPGQVKSLSSGGLLIQANNPHLTIGEDIRILTRPNLLTPLGFVKKGFVTNKQFIPHKVQFKSSCQYIITFYEQDPLVMDEKAEREFMESSMTQEQQAQQE
jgi:hypothetical protein